jgi:hypothetical protein
MHRVRAKLKQNCVLRRMAANKGSAQTTAGQHPPNTTPDLHGQPVSAPLEGKELLDRARSLSNRPEDQIARACGYVGPSGRVLKKSFYRALVAAKGYTLPSSNLMGGLSRGRHADFKTRVHGNGNLLIGQAYTRRMGLEPGQEFRIEIHRETGSIWLLPLEPEKN